MRQSAQQTDIDRIEKTYTCKDKRDADLRIQQNENNQCSNTSNNQPQPFLEVTSLKHEPPDKGNTENMSRGIERR